MKVSILIIIHALLVCVALPAGAQKKQPAGVVSGEQIEAESFFIEGLKAEMLEKPDEALEQYRKSISFSPGNAAAFYRIACLLLRKGKNGEALAQARKATRLDPQNPYYQSLRGQIEEEMQDWKAAVKTYRFMVEKLGGQKDYQLNIAQIAIRRGKWKDALRELDLAAAYLGPSPELYQLRMQLFLNQKDFKGAIRNGNDWIADFPDDPEGWFALVQVLNSGQKGEEASALLARMQERFPSNPTVHLMLVDIYLNRKEQARADAEMKKAFESPDLPLSAKVDILAGYLRVMNSEDDRRNALGLTDILLRVHPGEARAYLIRGDIYNKAGERREARNMYLKARNLDRNNFGLWEQTILIDLTLNEMDSVLAHTAEARELFPNTPSFWFYNGMANLLKKHYGEAVKSLEQARRISPGNNDMQFEIYSQLGDAYYNLKQPDKAFQAFEQALLLDSANAHVLNNYSYFLSEEKTSLDRALRLSTRLIRLFPEEATYEDTHGWVLFRMGRYAEALPFLESASKKSSSGVIREHFGDALFRNGKVDQAVSVWKEAAGLAGETSPELQTKIKEKRIP